MIQYSHLPRKTDSLKEITSGGFDIGCGQQQMALRIDQLLTPNHGAFDLINVNVKSAICPELGGGGGGGSHLQGF